MAALTQPQKLFIVQALACFDTPTEVRDQLKEDFGVDASLQQIQFYDPTTAQGSRELSPELKALFEATRTAFLADRTQSAIAHGSVRFRRLERMYHSRRVRNSPELQLKILEQAAKEEGGLYTVRREISGPGGGPIQVQEQPLDLSRLSSEQLATLESLVEQASDPAGDPGGEGAA